MHGGHSQLKQTTPSFFLNLTLKEVASIILKSCLSRRGGVQAARLLLLLPRPGAAPGAVGGGRGQPGHGGGQCQDRPPLQDQLQAAGRADHSQLLRPWQKSRQLVDF